MAYTMTEDISRLLLEGQKEIFMRNFESYPIEWPGYTVTKDSNKQTETYDSMGNLPKGGIKPEGDAINYGKVRQAYQTSVKNLTHANGFSHTLEAIEYDLYGAVNSIKAKELARTMREMEEERAIRWIDNATATNLTDGVPLASASHPLLEVGGKFNSTLATTGSVTDPDVHKAMINMFYNFKNHQGGPMKTRPTDGLSHFTNMIDIEEVYGSSNKAQEFSNTKNALPTMNWKYTTYSSSKTFFMMWDNSFDHILFQWYKKTQFDSDEDKISTKNVYFNALAMYETAAVPNVGLVFNQGS